MPRQAVLFLLALFSVASYGQKLNFEALREPVISLDGPWRFHTGDNPRWADPNFDDRGWSLLRADRSWGRQGFAGYYGIAWYRIAVEDVGDRPLALLLQPITNSYQVFANGQLIGGMGRTPPKPASDGEHPAVYLISRKPVSHPLVIAIRVWKNPVESAYYAGGFFETGSLLGNPDLIENRFASMRMQDLGRKVVGIVLNTLTTLAGLTALGLFIAGHSQPEYLWYAIAQISISAVSWFFIYSLSVPFPERLDDAIAPPLELIAVVFRILFYSRIFQASRDWFFWCVLLTQVLEIFSIVLSDIGAIDTFTFLVANNIAELFLICWLTWTAWRAIRRGVLDAQLLFGPLLLNNFVGLFLVSDHYLSTLGVAVPRYVSFFSKKLGWGPFHLYLYQITELLVLFAALAVLIGRFARTQQEEEQHTRDLEAARTLQHMLVPQESPTIPGYSIASVYQPAQQVGGDFFQIIPAANGVLLAIGDVSGKGLPAAMTVSLIVGALRTLADQTQSPASILAGLNRRLVGRSQGFTTCLIAYLQPSGSALLANAGHLSPYRNGEELQTTANLPLGIIEDTTYEESEVALHSNDCLTFVSDGVVEARNNKGDLFGFERAKQTSTQPAHIIATAAQQFGQEDDITVLTVQYQPLVSVT